MSGTATFFANTMKGQVLLLLAVLCVLSPSSSQAGSECIPGVKFCPDKSVREAIDSVAGGDQGLKVALYAISAQEGSGRAHPKDGPNYRKGVLVSLDVGAMQINTINWNTGGGCVGPDELRANVLKNVQCAAKVYKQMCKGVSGLTFYGALCAYNNGTSGCKRSLPNNRCPNGYPELVAKASGVDLNTGEFGTNPYTGESNLGVLDRDTEEGEYINCVDLGLSQAMMQASRAYQGVSITSGRTIFEQAVREDIKNARANKYLRGSIRYSYCLDMVFSSLDIIKMLVNFANTIVSQIVNMVLSLLNSVCQFIANTVNNVLSMMCLPLPNLNFGLDLAISSNRESCDGISLANLVSVYGGSPLSMPTTIPGYFYNMSRGITDPRTGHIRF